MKPSLESAPETDEDVLVWLKVADGMFRRDGTLTPVRFRCLGVRSLASDRRDAELMLFGQRWGGCCWATAVGNGTMVRCCQRVRGEYAGWCGDWVVFDITKCA